ncbi:MAG: transcriptional regulator [Ferruginibacter sp.]|nr:transcriptional regulator [Ferruginibacter sp.]
MKPCILIIEDNTDIRESAAEILSLSNYTVLQAADGKAGVETALKELPDMILCDIMMPVLDGYGVLHLLNKTPETAIIPFIFLTAKAERPDIRKGMERGADDYLTKPFDDLELLTAVETQLSKKNQQVLFYSATMNEVGTLAVNESGLMELQLSIEALRVRNIKKSGTIYQDGDTPAGLYVIISGRCKTVKIADDGRELLTGIFCKDDFFGISSLLSGDRYTESAIAMDDMHYCLLPKNAVEELLSRYPAIGTKFIKLLSANIQGKEEQLIQMAYQSVRKRMALLLLSLSKPALTGVSEEWLQLSRDEMASMAGMATETVSRILSDFTEEKLIEKEKKLIRIISRPRLTSLQN